MKYILSILFFLTIVSCSTTKPISDSDHPFRMQNLIPWSIVAFDSMERGPQERVKMIKDLGFSQYAFGGRKKHMDTFLEEIAQAESHEINISAVWLYLNAAKDKPGELRFQNEKVLEAIMISGIKPQIWVGFNPSYFEGLSDTEALTKGREMIAYLAQRAEKLGCRIGLYNHGGWMGNPDHQLQIINSLKRKNIGIVYNFHHGHDDIDRYETLFPRLLPHLYCVNLNGMVKNGKKILSIGDGVHEFEMINHLLELGYKGSWGILGHVKGGDAKAILQTNLRGLYKIMGGGKSDTPKASIKKKVFLLAGQSNMDGRADGGMMSPDDLERLAMIQDRVLFHYNKMKPMPLQAVTPKMYIQRKFNLKKSFGPELFFGINLAEFLPDDEFVFIKRSQGGTSLYGCWNPEWSIEKAKLMDEENQPRLFQDFIAYTKNTLASYPEDSYEIEGLLWVQGEDDSNSKRGPVPAENYYSNLKKLIQHTRAQLEVPALPMFIFQVGSGKVVEGMKQLAEEDENVFLITQSKDKNSARYFEKNPPPIGHYTARSMKKIGRLFFDVYVENLTK